MNTNKRNKCRIGDVISTFGRNIKIIDIERREIIRHKNKKPYKNHRLYYKYKCLNCGNEDWIIDYSLSSQQCGCNACCNPPRKLVVGINDIATTNPWMIKYFVNPSDSTKYFRFSKAKVDMVCPDCNRIHKSKSIHDVYRNGSLTCPCQDGWSYPNKFMYALLEQIGVRFETEKNFDWSDSRKYDDYIEYNGLKIITEQHGQQHYLKPFSNYGRTVKEEQENDEYKYDIAIKNGIDKYFIIDASVSSLDHMKNSIIDSGLLSLFNKSSDEIDWNSCDEFAISNLAKKICIYKQDNPNICLTEIANTFHIAYKTVLDYIKNGVKLGWCDYQLFDDLRLKRDNGTMLSGQRPIHCISDGKYYRSSKTFVKEYENNFGKHLQDRNIRSVCEGKRSHVNNLRFEYITQKEFNNIKAATPELAIGEFFKLKESA